MVEVIKKHCKEEGRRSEDDAQLLYEQRCADFESRAIKGPVCNVCNPVLKTEKEENVWVNSSDVYMESGFSYYHHPRGEVIKYAVHHRSDTKQLIKEMKEVHYSEYPAPTGSGKAYMVGSNGNHRTVVFKCIGLPSINALVSQCEEASWKWFVGWHRVPRKIAFWLEKHNLIELIDINEEGSEVTFLDHNKMIGWTLPHYRTGNLDDALREMSFNIKAAENSFKVRRRLILNVAKCRLLWRAWIELDWLLGAKKRNDERSVRLYWPC